MCTEQIATNTVSVPVSNRICNEIVGHQVNVSANVLALNTAILLVRHCSTRPNQNTHVANCHPVKYTEVVCLYNEQAHGTSYNLSYAPVRFRHGHSVIPDNIK